MVQFNKLAVWLLALALHSVNAGTYKMCKDNTCNDCPVGITNAGTGYPDCVTYDTESVLFNQGFSGTPGGGWQTYIDIPKLDYQCRIIIKSPANTDIAGCGYMIASFSQPTCAVLNLEKTFMVQFCCGSGDCNAAGASRLLKRSAKFGESSLDIEAAASGMYSLVLQYPNGTDIEPIRIGSPPVLSRDEGMLETEKTEDITERAVSLPSSSIDDKLTVDNNNNNNHNTITTLTTRSRCETNSWKPNAGQDEYTRPADNTQIVHPAVSGPGEFAITQSRTQTFTTSMSIGFADILSLGVSFEMSESVQDTHATTFPVEAGQSGEIGFTSFFVCTAGTGRCDGGQVKGEICTPKVKKAGDGSSYLDGIYSLVVHS
ncbi:hypothetical protein B0J18DRAFT_425017 [Chaetomium sp. MPI-SDFR-AT-0129]|nr:hypothetical protein B0J18DRAFT_425017 [Chaetomium sp. MPI-SDFR-AT-0129]